MSLAELCRLYISTQKFPPQSLLEAKFSSDLKQEIIRLLLKELMAGYIKDDQNANRRNRLAVLKKMIDIDLAD